MFSWIIKELVANETSNSLWNILKVKWPPEQIAVCEKKLSQKAQI